MKSPSAFIREGTYIIRQQSIFPGRYQPSIFDASELNFCVRNGNRCGLTAITTGMVESLIPSGLQRKLKSSRSENQKNPLKLCLRYRLEIYITLCGQVFGH